jgi:hypothetical protein
LDDPDQKEFDGEFSGSCEKPSTAKLKQAPEILHGQSDQEPQPFRGALMVGRPKGDQNPVGFGAHFQIGPESFSKTPPWVDDSRAFHKDGFFPRMVKPVAPLHILKARIWELFAKPTQPLVKFLVEAYVAGPE